MQYLHDYSKKMSPDPVEVYHDISIPGTQPSPLIRLALHILSICPNSASCERLFSTFGLIMTKLRTRISTKNLVNLAEFKLHLRDENMRLEARRNFDTACLVLSGNQQPQIPRSLRQTPLEVLLLIPIYLIPIVSTSPFCTYRSGRFANSEFDFAISAHTCLPSYHHGRERH